MQSYPQGQKPGAAHAQHSRVKWRRAGHGHDTRWLVFRLSGLIRRIACSLTHHVSDPWVSQGLTLRQPSSRPASPILGHLPLPLHGHSPHCMEQAWKITRPEHTARWPMSSLLPIHRARPSALSCPWACGLCDTASTHHPPSTP